MNQFHGKTIIITGASSGLGASLAEAFAGAGTRPVLFARSAAQLEAVADRCRRAGAEPLVAIGDVTVVDDCERVVAQTVERFGGIDMLIACAGLGMWARFDELRTPSVLREIMDVNYLGVVNPAYYALPHLKERSGMLVAISSVQGKIGVPFHSGYAASKHAVQGFCDSLRVELRGTGVDVLTVLAHWIRGTRLRERALGKDGAPRGNNSASHGSGAVPVEEMTRAILDAIRGRKRAIFVPGWLRYLSWLYELSPAVADSIIARRLDREAAQKRRE